MNKTERNEKIIEMSKIDKTQNEIANELGCSIRTVQRVIAENITTVEKSELNKMSKIDTNRQNEFLITSEMWESLQDKIDSMLDTIEVYSAKIKTLEAELIKTNKLSVNEIISSERYIIKNLRTKELIDYTNDLINYIPSFKNIPYSTIDRIISNSGSWCSYPDNVLIEFTDEEKKRIMENSINNLSISSVKMKTQIDELSDN